MLKRNAQIILALDVDSVNRARHFVNRLYPRIKIFKVGSQLFTLAGPQIIRSIHRKGAEVFLDLKFCDIPNTVANAVRMAARLKVKMLTLHICGGIEMLKAAVRAAKEEAGRRKIKKPLLIGVTVLTSQKAGPRQVLKLAKAGLVCGLDGVVCSVREAQAVRQACGKNFIIVTPGIRSKGADAGDQKRVATASDAIKAGANYIVVGRPILEARNPRKAVEELW